MNQPLPCQVADLWPDARKYAASAVNILATAVTPGDGHAQLHAERISESIQLGTRERAEAPCRVVYVNQVELDWQAAGQVRQPLGVALAYIHHGDHGPC